MIHRLGLLLLLPSVLSVTFVVIAPAVPDAAAQDVGGRRGDNEDRGEGQSRREGRGRGGRGRFGGGEGGGRGRFGGGEGGGGGSGLRRRGGDEGGRGGERPSRESGTSSFGGGNLDMPGYARRLIQENDKNGDMMLGKDEQGGLRGPAAGADSNNDGTITVDEVVAALSSGSSAGARVAGANSSGSRSDDSRPGNDRGIDGAGAMSPTRVYTALATGSGSGAAADKRRTYRFKPGADRLPATGLPSWFKSRDKNGDGQVAMNEYSRSWSDRTVNEFRRYDLNNDGVVTAKEATQR